jgi:short-subunit dehydrogenase
MSTYPTRAVITGASSGIGESFAREFAKSKVNLVLVARRKERLEQLAEELKRAYRVEVECIQLDITVPGAIESLLVKSTENGKLVDCLVNNAGNGTYRSFLDTDLDKHLGTLNLNLTTLIEGSHRFGLHMRAHGKPSYIVNIASVAAYQGTPKFAVYAASKFAVRVFSRVFNYELAGTNVSVTCVCPGGTTTEFLGHAGQSSKPGFKQRFIMMTSESVAKIGIKAMLARKPVVIPGLLNKFTCFIVRFVPEGLALYMAGKSMSSAVDEVPAIETKSHV